MAFDEEHENRALSLESYALSHSHSFVFNNSLSSFMNSPMSRK
jgi:hypothetical protein